MKRLLLILAIVCLLPLSAEAQWYLFPGGKKAKRKAQQEQKQNPQQPKVPQEEPSIETLLAPQDSSDIEEGDDMDFLEGRRAVNLNLILPIGINSDRPSSNFLEMYSGALMALKTLGEKGVKIKASLIDSSEEGFEEKLRNLGKSDIVLGPVRFAEFETALGRLDKDILPISPLDQKTESLAEAGEAIQASTPWRIQVDELVNWLNRDNQKNTDKVLLLRDTDDRGEQSAYLVSKLQDCGIEYTSLLSLDNFESDKERINRILIASEREAFISTAVRRIGILAEQGHQFILYSTSKIRNCVGPDVFDLYNAQTHMVATYHVNYDDEKVKEFTRSYRALFDSEPSSFAFQGYDLVNFFVEANLACGKRWSKRLPSFILATPGLQSDFRFSADYCAGLVNTATRHVVYNKDLTVNCF